MPLVCTLISYRRLAIDPSCLGEKALAVSESQAVSTIRGVAASAAFDMVKDQVSHFAENSKILGKVLNEVSKVHPFIQSVSCFVLTPSVYNNSFIVSQLRFLHLRRRSPLSLSVERMTKRPSR